MPKRLEPEQETQIRELYEKGLRDTEIGKAAGLTRNTVASWRKRTGRKSNYAPRVREIAALEARGTINPLDQMRMFFEEVGASTRAEKEYALWFRAKLVGGQ